MSLINASYTYDDDGFCLWDGQNYVPIAGGAAPAWTPLNLQNGWTQSGMIVPGWRLEGDIVRLRGCVDGTSAAYGDFAFLAGAAAPPSEIDLPGLGYDLNAGKYIAIWLAVTRTVDGSTPVAGLSARSLAGPPLAGAGGNPGQAYLDGITYTV